jgi:hypothetical protein
MTTDGFNCQYGSWRASGYVVQLLVIVGVNLVIFRLFAWPASVYCAVPVTLLLLVVFGHNLARFLSQPRRLTVRNSELEVHWRSRSLSAYATRIEIVEIRREASHHLFDRIVLKIDETEFSVFGDAKNFDLLRNWLLKVVPRETGMDEGSGSPEL